MWEGVGGLGVPSRAFVLCPGEIDPDTETEAKGGLRKRMDQKDRERDGAIGWQRETERQRDKRKEEIEMDPEIEMETESNPQREIKKGGTGVERNKRHPDRERPRETER